MDALVATEDAESPGTGIVPAAPNVLTIPGSRPLRNTRHERFCQLRSVLRPKIDAYRTAFENADYDEHAARGNASKLERRRDVADRIAFLCRQEEEVLSAKRRRLEEMLWIIHECNVAEMWRTESVPRLDKDGNPLVDENGVAVTKTVQRPIPIGEMPEDVQRAVEAITINEKGYVVPKPYSKLQANAELRKLLGIGIVGRDGDEGLSHLSDAELVTQLATQARELGIEIDLNYRFGG